MKKHFLILELVLLIGALRVGRAQTEEPPHLPATPIIGEGRYAIESIRTRASVDGVEQLIDISEAGSGMTDKSGNKHTLAERGLLTLTADGKCEFALAVSVDNEEPTVSVRSCSWKVDGNLFSLIEADAKTQTRYRVDKKGDRYIFEGLPDVAEAKGERMVLVQGRGPLGSRPNTDADPGGKKDAREPGPDEI